MYRYDFEPFYDYEESNASGGTAIAYAGDDFAVVAADTMINSGIHLVGTEQSWIFELTPKSVLGCGGGFSHALSLKERLSEEVKAYNWKHQDTINTMSLINVISLEMYRRRSNPYGLSATLAGLDSDGHGVACAFDALGHANLSKVCAAGVAAQMIEPVLDSTIGLKSEENTTMECAVNTIVEIYKNVAARNVLVGGSVEVYIITKDGIAIQKHLLKSNLEQN